MIALTIDEAGMAKTADRKVEVAKKIYEIVVDEYGLRPDGLIFDDLNLQLATGEEEFLDSGNETIEGIKRIKNELPGVLTSLGVSNVSFGFKLAARAVLNSVFLYHCVQAGLDMAIVNPAHIKPYAEIPEEQRALADDLIFNRRTDALPRFINFFEGVTLSVQAAVDETIGMTDEQKCIGGSSIARKKISKTNGRDYESVGCGICQRRGEACFAPTRTGVSISKPAHLKGSCLDSE